MKIKRVEGVQKVRITSLTPGPEIYASYDGLAGLSERTILKDLLNELERGTVEVLAGVDRKGGSTRISREEFISLIREKGSGRVYVYFEDYVSYGAGAGEEVAEFFFRSMPLVHMPAGKDGGQRERLRLLHTPTAIEEVEIGSSA